MTTPDTSLQNVLALVVEPSRSQAHIIINYLNELGIQEPQCVETQADAIAFMEDSAPEVVISAMHLTDGSGVDLVLNMRESENETLQNMPFLLISSSVPEDEKEKFRQSGLVAILPKPFGTHQLNRALVSMLKPCDNTILDLDHFDVETLQVLIVDDSPPVRRHITRVLESLGVINFTHATNGAEAIELIKNNYYDLVVTDYHMPEVDGKALVQFIRKESSQSTVPILMVTSEDNEQRLAEVEQEGVSGICDKPFETNFVRELLARILTKEFRVFRGNH